MTLRFELTRRLCSLAYVLGSRRTPFLLSGTASVQAYTSICPKSLQHWPGISIRYSKSTCTGPVSLELQRDSKKNSPDSLPSSSASRMTSKSSKQQQKASRPRAKANGDKEDKSRRRHNMQQKGLDPASVCRALVALGKAGRADEAENLWNQCEANGMLDEELVGILCAIFAEAAEPEVREVLIGTRQSGVPINRLHYMAAMRAYHKTNRSNEAQWLLNEMISQDCELDAFEFQLLADMFANRKQPHMVEDVLRRWVALGGQVTGRMFAVSAKAYAYQEEPDQVKRILAEMRQNSLEINPQAWGSLVYALVNAGQLEGALEVMSGLQNSGVAPDRCNYNMIITAMFKSDDETYCLPRALCAKLDCRSGKQQLRNMESLTTGRLLCALYKQAWGHGGCGGCQDLVLTTAEQDFMQSSILKLYPIFRYAEGKKGVYNSTEIDLHNYDHWSCQLALLAGLSMMYDRFLNTTWQWPKSEDLQVLVKKGFLCLTERQVVKDAAWHFLKKLFVVRMDNSGGTIVVKRLDVLDWFHALKREGIVLNAVHCKKCFSPRSSTAQGR